MKNNYSRITPQPKNDSRSGLEECTEFGNDKPEYVKTELGKRVKKGAEKEPSSFGQEALTAILDNNQKYLKLRFRGRTPTCIFTRRTDMKQNKKPGEEEDQAPLRDARTDFSQIHRSTSQIWLSGFIPANGLAIASHFVSRDSPSSPQCIMIEL